MLNNALKLCSLAILYSSLPQAAAERNVAALYKAELLKRSPIPDPVAQGDVYQVSGAIYVAPGAGNQQWSQAAPAICPNNAPQGCGNINVWNWCCYSGTTCYKQNDGTIGCCGNSTGCSGYGYVAPAGTVTVTVYPTTTAPAGGTTVFVAGFTTTNYATPSSTTTQTARTTQYIGGQFCSTITAKGPNLPTTAQAPCGTVLIVSDASANHSRGLVFLFLIWALHFATHLL